MAEQEFNIKQQKPAQTDNIKETAKRSVRIPDLISKGKRLWLYKGIPFLFSQSLVLQYTGL